MPALLTARCICVSGTEGNDCFSKLIYNCDKNMWHKFRDEAEMKITHTDSELEYYSVTIPLTDTRFSYIFELPVRMGRSDTFLKKD